MHILFLSHYFPPEGNAPATRTFQNCRRWVKEGHKVTVITCFPNVPSGKVYEGYKNSLTKTEIIDGISVIRVWTFLAANKGTCLRIVNYLSYVFTSVIRGFFVKKPDIIIATSPQFFCGWAGIILSKIRFKRFVLEIRDIWPSSIAAVGSMKNGITLSALMKLELLMYNLSDHIITVGDGYRKEILQRGIQREKISVIPNGADFENYQPLSKSQNSKNNTKELTIAYVGTLGMACGLDCVIEAAEKLEAEGIEDIKFLLVGDGAIRKGLIEKANAKKIKNIEFTGLVAKNQIPKILRSVDICLIHLKNEPLFRTVLPSKMFEAFAASKPIILGVLGEAEKVLKNANAGILMDPENPQSLIDSINSLRSIERRERLGKNGREYALEHFNRDNLARIYLKLLKKIAQNQTRIPA